MDEEVLVAHEVAREAVDAAPELLVVLPDGRALYLENAWGMSRMKQKE